MPGGEIAETFLLLLDKAHPKNIRLVELISHWEDASWSPGNVSISCATMALEVAKDRDEGFTRDEAEQLFWLICDHWKSDILDIRR